MKKVTVFIASPGDVTKERTSVDLLLNNVNQITATCFGTIFEVRKWENVVPSMGRPQEVINTQLEIERCDIFIGIIWSRFGSPTGINKDGKSIESGTEEEFEIAYEHWKKTKTPSILIYRCVRNIPAKVDSTQIAKVNDFFLNFGHDLKHPGLYSEYRSIKELEDNIRKALIFYVYQKNQPQRKSQNFENGIDKIFTTISNRQRMDEKRKQLENTNTIYLVAHSGYSFIANYGNKYRRTIEDYLNKGNIFRLIITNPWSESGLFLALGEKDLSEVTGLCVETPNGLKTFRNSSELVKNSEWYSIKFMDSINGFLMLQKKYGDRIQMRISKYEIPSSVLITDDYCFYEPLLPVNIFERQIHGLLVFESMISNKSSIYKHAKAYFDFLWTISESYDVYVSNENLMINRFLGQKICVNNTFVGAHALIVIDKRILILKRSSDNDYRPNVWDLPGGTVEFGESIEDSLERELLEETGLSIKVGNPIYVYTNNSQFPGRQTFQMVYKCEVIGDHEVKLNNEHSDYKWVNYKALKEYNCIEFLEQFRDNFDSSGLMSL